MSDKISALPPVTSVPPLYQMTGIDLVPTNWRATAAVCRAPDQVSAVRPTATDDDSLGYVVGSRWLNSSTGLTWLCLDASTGAAVWTAQGPNAQPDYRSGIYYSPDRGTVNTAAAMAADRMYATPLAIRQRVTITELMVRIATGVAATEVIMALYSSAGGLPDALLHQVNAAVPTTVSASNGLGVFAVNPDLPPAIYWTVVLGNGAPTLNNRSNSDTSGMYLMGAANPNQVLGTTGQTIGFSAARNYALGFPATFGAATQEGSGAMPLVAFRTA